MSASRRYRWRRGSSTLTRDLSGADEPQRNRIPMNEWTASLLSEASRAEPPTSPTLGEVLHGLREPVIVADRQFRVSYANPAAERALGVLPGGSAGRPLPELLPGRYSAPEPDAGDLWRFRRSREGWVAYGSSSATVEEGWTQRVIEAEQLAAVGQLAAGVAHEIGAPLTAISVAVEYLIKSTPPEAEDVRRDLELVLSQTQRISRLTRRLVDLAKPAEPEFKPTDLNAIVQEGVEFVERQLRRDAVQCTILLDGSLPPIRADAHHLQQVLLNLLLNAHRAVLTRSPAERRVEVRTGRQAGWAELTVADTGPGIEPDDLHRIFLPFFSRAGSTGMGLTVVWNIVHQHGGTIEARSQPGQGASFLVRLPLTEHGKGD
jgi:signal transduction histidine kinase